MINVTDDGVLKVEGTMGTIASQLMCIIEKSIDRGIFDDLEDFLDYLFLCFKDKKEQEND